MASSSTKINDSDLSLEELVFSCTICQATPSEVYATIESNQGFHSGSGRGEEDGIVTKMWIAECSHITCAKHLENGAAPFHPTGVQPRAPCPKCQRDKSDNDPKDLYGIRGLADGQYDPMIPSEWRKCPAIKLDTSVPGMSAVRFQYMALAHFAKQARVHWRTAELKRVQSETAHHDERKRCHELQKESRELKEQVEYLKKVEVEYKKWEARKPEIRHYLDAVNVMSKDIESMRSQLYSLGVHVPERKYTFEEPRATPRGRSRTDVPRARLDTGHSYLSSSRKRKRNDHSPDDPDLPRISRTPLRRSSREIMPPPPPKSSPSKEIHHAALHATQPRDGPTYSDPLAGAYQQGGWQRVRDPMGLGPPHSGYSSVQDDFQRHASLHAPHPRHGSPSVHQFSYELPSTPRVNGHIQSPTRYREDRQDHLHRSRSGLVEALPNFRAHHPTLYTSTQPIVISSPQKSFDHRETSAISPFFRREDLQSGGSRYQRPLTRGSVIRDLHDTQTYPQSTGGHPRSPSITANTLDDSRQALNGAYTGQLQQRSRLQSTHPTSTHWTPDLPHTPLASVIPKTTRNSEGLLRRPDPLPSSSTYSSGKSRSNVYRGFPREDPSWGGSSMYHKSAAQIPNSVRRTIARPTRADEALSQVPGVKGLRAQPISSSYQQPGSSYGAVRGLFSSADGRRSVRR